jgi:hypothetical protein
MWHDPPRERRGIALAPHDEQGRCGQPVGRKRQRLKSLPIPDRTPPSFFGGAPDGFLGGGDVRGGGLDRCPVGGVERRADGVVRRCSFILARRIS